jgi:hypothetical protein
MGVEMTDNIKWDASAPLVMTGQLYISPAAQPKSITFRNTSDSTEILRITKDGVHANPDVPVDEAAQAVLAALDNNIKVLVKKAVEAEREACAQVCDAVQKKNEDNGAWMWEARNCAAAIRARSKT